MSAVMTYTSLLNDMTVYADRSDPPFITQLPRFVMIAENRIASEIQNLGMQNVVTGVMTIGNPVITKPSLWRETISFNFGTGTNNDTRNTLYERTYEWCRNFWPDSTQIGIPRYYCDYNQDNFLIAATPNTAYPFELVYRARPTPLDNANQTNWTTEYAPQLILSACMLAAQPFLKNLEMVQLWQGEYDRCGQALSKENNSRVTDRSSTVK